MEKQAVFYWFKNVASKMIADMALFTMPSFNKQFRKTNLSMAKCCYTILKTRKILNETVFVPAFEESEE